MKPRTITIRLFEALHFISFDRLTLFASEGVGRISPQKKLRMHQRRWKVRPVTILPINCIISSFVSTSVWTAFRCSGKKIPWERFRATARNRTAQVQVTKLPVANGELGTSPLDFSCRGHYDFDFLPAGCSGDSNTSDGVYSHGNSHCLAMWRTLLTDRRRLSSFVCQRPNLNKVCASTFKIRHLFKRTLNHLPCCWGVPKISITANYSWHFLWQFSGFRFCGNWRLDGEHLSGGGDVWSHLCRRSSSTAAPSHWQNSFCINSPECMTSGLFKYQAGLHIWLTIISVD